MSFQSVSKGELEENVRIYYSSDVLSGDDRKKIQDEPSPESVESISDVIKKKYRDIYNKKSKKLTEREILAQNFDFLQSSRVDKYFADLYVANDELALKSDLTSKNFNFSKIRKDAAQLKKDLEVAFDNDVQGDRSEINRLKEFDPVYLLASKLADGDQTPISADQLKETLKILDGSDGSKYGYQALTRSVLEQHSLYKENGIDQEYLLTKFPQNDRFGQGNEAGNQPSLNQTKKNKKSKKRQKEVVVRDGLILQSKEIVVESASKDPTLQAASDLEYSAYKVIISGALDHKKDDSLLKEFLTYARNLNENKHEYLRESNLKEKYAKTYSHLTGLHNSISLLILHGNGFFADTKGYAEKALSSFDAFFNLRNNDNPFRLAADRSGSEAYQIVLGLYNGKKNKLEKSDLDVLKAEKLKRLEEVKFYNNAFLESKEKTDDIESSFNENAKAFYVILSKLSSFSESDAGLT